MNKRGQIDELNPAYLGLALLGGAIVFFMFSYWEKHDMYHTSIFIRILFPLISMVITYVYLAMTE